MGLGSHTDGCLAETGIHSISLKNKMTRSYTDVITAMTRVARENIVVQGKR